MEHLTDRNYKKFLINLLIVVDSRSGLKTSWFLVPNGDLVTIRTGIFALFDPVLEAFFVKKVFAWQSGHFFALLIIVHANGAAVVVQLVYLLLSDFVGVQGSAPTLRYVSDLFRVFIGKRVKMKIRDLKLPKISGSDFEVHFHAAILPIEYGTT